MFRFLIILSIISLSACAPQATPTAIIEPTQSLQIPVPSDWAGAIIQADGTTESILVHLNETAGTLNIEPKTKSYDLKNIQHIDSKISFKVTAENEMNFSGEFDGAQIIGQIERNGQTDTFTL